MIFISKMVPTNDKGRFYAFGRVFSGTVSNGQKVRIMGPNYTPGSKKDLYVQNIQRVVLMMGSKEEQVTDVPCGNTVGLYGIDNYLVKQGTIATHQDSHCIRVMKYSVSPVVRVAVAPQNVKDLPKLVKGLKTLSQSDPLVVCSQTDTGEYVVAGSGELHVDICLQSLEEDFAQISIKRGNPIVSYKETVSEMSSQVCMAKSTNKLNRIFGFAQPLGEELNKEIERGGINPTQDPIARSRLLTEKFEWDPNEAKKIWCFGPEVTAENILVDSTKAVAYLNDIKDSVKAGFEWATSEGVLTQETVKGVRYDICDAVIHSDNMHRGGAMIIPASRRTFYASQHCAQPKFLEPIFLVEIQCPDDVLGNVYSCIYQRRGSIFEENSVQGTPMMIIKAHLPVAESFGFTQALRAATQGRAFPQCVFDHWSQLQSDPFEEGSKANILATEIRTRKGLKAEIPAFENFFDKL